MGLYPLSKYLDDESLANEYIFRQWLSSYWV